MVVSPMMPFIGCSQPHSPWWRAGPKEPMNGFMNLEAQQRYFSYRALLVAIVSQNSFVLVFMGYRTVIARYVENGASHRCACVKLSAKGGVSHHFGGLLTSLGKVSHDMGLVSQYRAICGHSVHECERTTRLLISKI